MRLSGAWEVLWTNVHDTLTYLAAAVVFLHIAAALWHHVIRKDVMLQLMMPLVSDRKSAK
ncbi:hypothetical protein RE439_22550 [Agrobacterium rosae]|nr:cytochrome b/b6 domain-containing protein [Agrobacterium rosae]